MATRGNAKVATRYAKAVLDSVLQATKQPERVRKVAQELANFAKLIAGNKELTIALWSDIFSREERAGVLEDLATKMGLSPETKRVLVVTSNAGRLRHLEVLAEKLDLLLLESSGVVPLKVLAPTELSSEDRKQVESKFSKIFGKQVEASYEIDSSLLGGLRVTAAGRTYDGSISGWLESFEEKLAGGSI
jgi:F-type H+-transporting ATPase subunit delta